MRTRLLMIAACVGAVLVLGTSMAFSWPVEVRGGGGSDAPTPEDERLLAFDSPRARA
ncbi:hypothetical protein ACFQV2_39535 [Actinokineospora soli]|uniref:Uncharacterized protein n=1 Tax=Actinokineospora soli TaxID=1048753 RepID=A0ABW2TYT3_9PSEU